MTNFDIDYAGVLNFEDHTALRHDLGTVVRGTNKDIGGPICLCYVKANIALSAGLPYFLFFNAGDSYGVIDTSVTTANVALLSAVADTRPVGVAVSDIPAGSYGWIATEGVFNVKTHGPVGTALSSIYTSNSGKFDDDTASQHKFYDVSFLTIAAAADETVPVLASRPLVVNRGV